MLRVRPLRASEKSTKSRPGSSGGFLKTMATATNPLRPLPPSSIKKAFPAPPAKTGARAPSMAVAGAPPESLITLFILVI